ncbi:nitrous oxide-stimulated promoter family protein [Paludibacter propionicigenes]|nr:nitrous oxide-stimulated promoter family protein [Paludibacter propionicigenes]
MGNIEQEKLTVHKMISLYCRKKHRTVHLCEDCSLLMQYAIERLSKCPFGDEKGKCANCTIHCYKPDFRLKIKEVMRFSGPRMLLYHPLDFLNHIKKNRL